MPTPFPPSPSADTGVPSTCGDIRFVPAVAVEPVGESPDVPTREACPSIPDSPPTPPRRDESSLPLEEDPRSTHFIPEPVSSVFRICDANVQGLDVQEAHIRARSKSERAPMKTFMYVQNLELRACTPLVPGIFWPRKIQNFGAPGMNAGVRPKHERIRTNTFTYVQVLDVHGKY